MVTCRTDSTKELTAPTEPAVSEEEAPEVDAPPAARREREAARAEPAAARVNRAYGRSHARAGEDRHRPGHRSFAPD